MVLALLDELPCIINEADELMARVGQLATASQPAKEEGENRGVGLDRLQFIRSSSSHQTDQDESTTTHSESSADEQRSSSAASSSTPLSVDNLDATIKFFGKHFLLAQPVAVDKLKAALPPAESPQREFLRALASRGYHLMKRVHHWQQNAWETLTKHLEETSSLTFDNHRRIAELLLDAVVRYVKLNLLWSSLASIPGLLSLHGFFQHLQTSDQQQREQEPSTATTLFSQPDHTDHRVREFVLCFGTNALLKIQQDFAQHPSSSMLASALVALLRSSLPRWLRCYDLAELRNRGVFDVDALYHAGSYAAHPAFLDIADTASVPEWALCVALCVPHYLKVSPDLAFNGSDSSHNVNSDSAINVTLWEAVLGVLGDRLMLVVHRDYCVNAHGLLFQQVISCTTTTTANSGGINQPPPPPTKKELVAFGKHALLTCGKRRHQRREIVAHLLATGAKLLEHNPALAGPLFPMLTAALTLAAGEIEWLLAHEVPISTGTSTTSVPLLLPSFLKAKHWHRARFPDHSSELCTMLALTHRLQEVVNRNLDFVTPYYRAFLVNGDADAIAHVIQTFVDKQSESGFDEHVVRLLQSFQDRDRYQLEPTTRENGRRHSNFAGSNSSGSTWVREWQQTAAYFATARVPLPVELRLRIELACKHVEYARADVNSLLERVASFSKAWWFRRGVERCFSAPTNVAGTSIAIIDIFSRFLTGEYAISERLGSADQEKEEEESSRLKVEQQRLVERLTDAFVNRLATAMDYVVVHRAACASWVNVSRPPIHWNQHVRDERGPRDAAPVTPVPHARSQPSDEPSLGRPLRRPSLVSIAKPPPLSTLSTGKLHHRRDSKHEGDKSDSDDADTLLFQLTSSICEQHAFAPTTSAQVAQQVLYKCATRLLQRIVVVESGSASDQDKARGPSDDRISLSLSFEAACCAWQCMRQTARHHFDGVIDCKTLLDQILVRESRSSVTSAPGGTAKTLLALALSRQGSPAAITLVDKLACFFVALVTQKCLPNHGSCTNGTNPKREAPILVASPKLRCFLYASPSVEHRNSTHSTINPRTYTSPEAFESLTNLVGRSGVRCVSDTLVELLGEQIHALRLSLEVEEVTLTRIDQTLKSCTSARDVTDAIKQFSSADELASQLTRIGVTAFTLQLIDRALNSDGGWEVQVHRACFAAAESTAKGIHPAWRRLPAACAAAFNARAWKRSRLIPDAAATDSNVHIAGVAIALLLRRSLAMGEDAGDQRTSNGNGLSTVETAARHVGRVIRSCALVVLALEQAELQHGQRPFGRARVLALETAVRELGTAAAPDWAVVARLLDRGILRELLPPAAG